MLDHTKRPGKTSTFLTLTITGASLAVLPLGCTVGPDYAAPQTKSQVPASWKTPLTTTQPATQPAENAATQPASTQPSLETAALGKWWNIFHDPVLDRLVDQAIEGNLDLRLATARLREARAQRQVVAADNEVQIDAKGSYSRERPSPNAVRNRVGKPETLGGNNHYKTGLDASWELDIFGGTRRQIEAAEADIESSVYSREQVLVSLIGEVARNYVELRSFQERIRIATENAEAQRQSLSITQARAKAGLVSQLDVSQAEALLAITLSDIPTFAANASTSRNQIAVLLGVSPQALDIPLDVPGPIPSAATILPIGLPSELLLRRPDVRQAERNFAAATARIGAAKADLYPKFSLTGAFGLESVSAADFFAKHSIYYALGPAIRWPIFQGGRIKANIAVQDAKSEQALVQYESTVLVALREVEDALVTYLNEQQRRKLLGDAVKANKTSLSLSQELYSRGLGDFLNVLDAQRSLLNAEDSLVQSDRLLTQSLVTLYKALGGGWENVQLAKSDPNIK